MIRQLTRAFQRTTELPLNAVPLCDSVQAMINHPHLLPGRWRPLDKPEFGVMNNLSLSISRGEIAEPNLLPNLRRADTLFVVSDFGGLHKTSPCETFSFLFVDPSSFATWQDRWRAYRSRYLRDGRRMAFKSLSDKRRRQALIPFLQAANHLNGLIVTIIIPKSLGSFFSESGKLEIGKEELREFSHWRPMSFERLLRGASLYRSSWRVSPLQDKMYYGIPMKTTSRLMMLACMMCARFTKGFRGTTWLI